MHKPDPGLRWLTWRQWRHHSTLHIAVILLLTTGFCLYILYGSWSRAALAPTEEHQLVELPSDVVVRTPAWVAQVHNQQLAPSSILHNEEVSVYVSSRVRLGETQVYGPHGRVFATGLDPAEQWNTAELLGAYFPAGFPNPGEVLVPEEWVESGQWEVGTTIRLGHAAGIRQGVVHWADFGVRGTYVGRLAAPRGLVIHLSDWQRLTTYQEPNVLLLWEGPDTKRARETPVKWIKLGNHWVAVRPFIEVIQDHLKAIRFPVLSGGTMLPFGWAISQEVLHKDSVAAALLTARMHSLRPVWSLMGLVFCCLIIGLTTMVTVLVIQYQRAFGTMRAMGAYTHEVRRIYHLQFGMDFAAATIVGTIIAITYLPILGRFLGVPLTFPVDQGLLWLLAGVPVIWWSGQAVSILVDGADVIEQLTGRARFDWWRLVRFGHVEQTDSTGVGEKPRPRVLVVGDLPAAAVSLLEERAGTTMVPEGEAGTPPTGRFAELLGAAEGLLCGPSLRVDCRVLDSAPQLRAIATWSSTLDHIADEEARRRGIMVASAPVNPRIEAQRVLAIILATAEGLVQTDHRMWPGGRGDTPQLFRPRSLEQAVLGIIGAGPAAALVARWADELGMMVCYSAPSMNLTFERESGARLRPFNSLLAEADWVWTHAPSASTGYQLDSTELALMKSSAWLINTGHRGLVDEEALVHALREEKLAGAALRFSGPDELPPESGLLTLPNVILVPSARSEGPQARVQVARDLVDALAGHRPLGLVK